MLLENPYSAFLWVIFTHFGALENALKRVSLSSMGLIVVRFFHKRAPRARLASQAPARWPVAAGCQVTSGRWGSKLGLYWPYTQRSHWALLPRLSPGVEPNVPKGRAASCLGSTLHASGVKSGRVHRLGASNMTAFSSYCKHAKEACYLHDRPGHL